MDIINLDRHAVSPAILSAIEMVSSDDFSMSELSDVISQDPTLSATLLKYVNSSMYNTRSEITDVKRAAIIMGVNALRNAVMETMISLNPSDETLISSWEQEF
jgi:HD-like signal output (HDOD) protein